MWYNTDKPYFKAGGPAEGMVYIMAISRKEQFIKIVSPFSESEAVAEKYADHLCELFDVIVPERIGADFAAAVESEDYALAVKLCADYYRAKPACGVSSLRANGGGNVAYADRTCEGYACEVNIEWEFENGDVDFLFDPTEKNPPRNHEWLWQYNRHGYWANLANVYASTKDEKYAVAYRKQLLKWIAQTYVPERWNGPGSAWRTIECGIRLMGSWPVSYDGFRHSRTLEDAVILLNIASMHRQATHLVAHPTGNNWLMMEADGTYTFSALFTELSDSETNRGIAAGHLLRELENQILPDGMQFELSPDYQSVVYNCVISFYRLAKGLGLADEIPESFVKLMKDTVNAAILLSTPAFTQPRTNDCFTILTNRFTNPAKDLLGDNPEYYFVSSGRAQGEPPKGETASAFLPYAGFAAMRTDWTENASYCCFDVGPLGMAHVHQDKLNVNIFKGGEELIYDDGGGQYEISDARTYALSGYGHNTALVDGLSQHRGGPKMVTEPIDAGWITNDVFDYACGVYDDTFGVKEQVKSATHKREVRFCKPDFFCVRDTLSTADGNPHDYEIMFRLDTTEVATIDGVKNGVISCYNGKNGRQYEVAIIPLDCPCAEVELKTVSAATEPMQGWYNGRNENNLHEAITVSRAVKSVEKYVFTTLFFPVKRGEALPEVKRDGSKVQVVFNGEKYEFDLNGLNR